ncbi:hypothetical protein ACO0OL_000850 [Hanseniaspora opuntiae]
MSSVRYNKFAGSWYTDSATELKKAFEKGTSNKHDNVKKSSFVLAPHAGHRFCLSQILSSLNHLDINLSTKTIILIGPSHRVAFKNKIYLSCFKELQTPLGNLNVDYKTINELSRSLPQQFSIAPESMDQNEHCLEIICPVLKHFLDLNNKTSSKYFEKYITKEDISLKMDINKGINLLNLASMLILSPDKKIHTDVYEKMDLLELADMSPLRQSTSILSNFKKYLLDTEDTICGMYPIIVVLNILDDETLRSLFNLSNSASFEFVDYNYSNKVFDVNGYRVSYVSGFVSS